MTALQPRPHHNRPWIAVMQETAADSPIWSITGLPTSQAQPEHKMKCIVNMHYTTLVTWYNRRAGRQTKKKASLTYQTLRPVLDGPLNILVPRGQRPEVAILGADQKERGLWGRECALNSLPSSITDVYHVTSPCKWPYHVLFLISATKLDNC